MLFRSARIAKGSGRTVTEVNSLVDRFSAAAKMMKQMARGGGVMPQVPGAPAMPAIPGMPRNFAAPSGAKNQPPKKKSRSGNPAKRAAEEGR